MAEEELKADYTCTQQELYSLSRTIASAAKETADQAKLVAHKALYTPAYLNGLLTEIDTAEALPGETTREDKHETERIDLRALLKVCLLNFQTTKSYIDTAYEKQYRKVKYDTAGGAKYEKASKENWEFAKGMNNELLAFLTANQTLLESNNNMPATFIAKVTADNLAFHTKYESFKLARQTSDETQAKLTANNKLYAKISSLASDGVLVWNDNEGKRNRFVIAKVLELISPPGSASLEVEVLTSAFTGAGNAFVKIQAEGSAAKSATCTAEGLAKFENADPAVYKYFIFLNENDATPVATGKKDVNKGVNARLKVVLP